METILLAEFNTAIQGIVKVTLQKKGYEVYLVKNGEAAVEMVKEIRPGIILANASLPGRDGYELCRTIREIKELSNIPFGLLIGKAQPYDDKRGVEAGIDKILKYPFQSQELVNTVSFLKAKASEKIPDSQPPPDDIVKEEQPSEPRTFKESAGPSLRGVNLLSLKEEFLGDGLLDEEEGGERIKESLPEKEETININKVIERSIPEILERVKDPLIGICKEVLSRNITKALE